MKICNHHVGSEDDYDRCCFCGEEICPSIDPDSGVGCCLTLGHSGLCENPELCDGKYPQRTWQAVLLDPEFIKQDS